MPSHSLSAPPPAALPRPFSCKLWQLPEGHTRPGRKTAHARRKPRQPGDTGILGERNVQGVYPRPVSTSVSLREGSCLGIVCQNFPGGKSRRVICQNVASATSRHRPAPTPDHPQGTLKGRSGGGAGGDGTGSGGAQRRWMPSEGGAALDRQVEFDKLESDKMKVGRFCCSVRPGPPVSTSVAGRGPAPLFT